jgi:hypothetical protein
VYHVCAFTTLWLIKLIVYATYTPPAEDKKKITIGAF